MKNIRRPLRTGLLLTALFVVSAAFAQSGDGTNYAELKRIQDRESARAFASKMKAQAIVSAQGMPVRKVDPISHQIMEVVKLDDNGMPLYYFTYNKRAAITTRAARIWPSGGAGLSLTGSGVVLAIWDGGSVRTTHEDLTGRVTNFDGSAVDFHPTHVAGTMIATGIRDFSWTGSGGTVTNAGRGMSYQGTLRSFDWTDDTSEVAAEAAAGTPIRVSNHSYGPGSGWGDQGGGSWVWFGWTPYSATEDWRFGAYDSACRTFDEIGVNAPQYLSVWAVGNDRGEGPTSQPVSHLVVNPSTGQWTSSSAVRDLDGGATGYDTISGVGCAKNVLSVGAVNEVLNYTGPGSVTMSSFSGWGPTDDGRIKPDIVAKGVNLLSTGYDANDSYYFSSGTSMASPNVAGSLGLLIQHYRATHAGGDMRSATMRGLVIHTADECGSFTGPDYIYGWGLMDTEAAAKIISDDQTNPDVIRESALPNGSTHTYRVTSDGTTPLRFTLCWTDLPGTAQNGIDVTAPRLVNDLDMRVTIGGTTYFPYKLNPASPAAAATQGENDVDNVELIEIPAPAAGTYTITIDHDGTLSGPQNYSLITTGPVVSPFMSAFTINGTWITGGNSTNGTVTISSPAPAGGVRIYPRVIPAGSFNINAPVIIPEGQTSKTFPIVGTGNVNVNTAYSVWMDAGYKSIGVAGTMVPLRINALNVTPNPVSSGGSVNMTVGLNGPAPSGGLVLTVDRAPTFWIQAPATVTIPQGQFGATFNIPIRAGLTSTQQGRLSIIQTLQPSGTARLDKLFTINP